MKYIERNRRGNEEYQERMELVSERLAEIRDEADLSPGLNDYFKQTATVLLELKRVAACVSKDADYAVGAVGKELNYYFFERQLGAEIYGTSYLNPTFAVRQLGDFGAALSAIFACIRSDITEVYQGNIASLCLKAELMVELYVQFLDGDATSESVREVISSFFHDNAEFMDQQNLAFLFDENADFFRSVLMESDLSNPDFLYRYGLYVGANETGIFNFLKTLPKKDLQAMADTYTEGFRIGFINGGKPLEKKEFCEVRYPVGFEPMVRLAVLNFEKMNLSVVARPYSTQLNKQYVNDHEKDNALWLDKSYVERATESYKRVIEEYRERAPKYAGPAVVECFGEIPFEPESRDANLKYDKKQQELAVQLTSAKSRILNQYIHGEERSFTIIAYPIPEIGERFEEIFAETVKVNTLDYKLYEAIQQKLIDVLDTADYVHVLGRGDNRTDIRVKIYPLSDRSKETAFENCVADVNIPVGEVFTSPVLEGTSGKLHVTQVYLRERNFLNLELDFEDGKIASYSCTNFESESENKRYIEDNILFNHKTLPLGEFAIGTNTTAYRMGITYDIQAKLPILIAEKTGPHFAVGDTCYSYDEENETFNPDGKKIVARDNSISLMRKEDVSKAYFNCHTDITIPYNELESIVAVSKDGTQTPIILGGKFVVPGTEELNIPLEGLL